MNLQLTACQVDIERRIVVRDGVEDVLTPLEEGLLRYLVLNRGRVVTHAELLERVWGYRPGVESGAVKLTVFRLRKKLERDPKHPDHVLAARGSGYRFELAEAVLAPASFSPTGSTNLPEPRTAFFGRARELEHLQSSVVAGRLTALVGTGGVGKTRLALEACRALLASGTLAQCWTCDLSGAREAPEIELALARALDLSADQLTSPEGLAQILDRPDCLIVLDNCEQVVGPLGRLLEHWLQATQASRFLVTSREASGVAGETVIELGPLDAASAIRLFEDRARAAGRSVQDDGSIARIVDLVDALPLSVELAAGRVVALSPADIALRLGEPFRILKNAGSDRQASLAQTIDGSWALLDPVERRAWAQCGAFSGSFDLAAAEAVLDSEGWVGDVLQGLCRKHLLTSVEVGGQVRFSMLGTLWHYAATKLDELAEAPVVRRRHAHHFAALAGEPDIPRLDVERDNLLRAHGWAETDDRPLAARLCAAILPILARTGPVERGLKMAESALAMSDLDPSLRSLLLRSEAELRFVAGDIAGMRRCAQASFALATTAVARTESLLLEAEADIHDVRLAEAGALLDRAFVEAKAGPLFLEGQVNGTFGKWAMAKGQPDAAEAALLRSLEIRREVGDRMGEVTVLNNLGVLAARGKDYATGEARYRDAADLFLAYGERRRSAIARGNQGWSLYRQGRRDDARVCYRQALALSEACGDRLSQAQLLQKLAELHFDEGDVEEGNRSIARAIRLLRASGDLRGASRTLIRTAWRAVSDGRHWDAAAAHAELGALIEPEWQHEQAFHEAIAAGIAQAEGKTAEGEAALERAEALARDVDPWPILSIQDVLQEIRKRRTGA